MCGVAAPTGAVLPCGRGFGGGNMSPGPEEAAAPSRRYASYFPSSGLLAGVTRAHRDFPLVLHVPAVAPK